jgi:hypothetical protein
MGARIIEKAEVIWCLVVAVNDGHSSISPITPITLKIASMDGL